MRQVFNERSVLFLGCGPRREEYKNFFQKFAVNAKVECLKLPIRGFSSVLLGVVKVVSRNIASRL